MEGYGRSKLLYRIVARWQRSDTDNERSLVVRLVGRRHMLFVRVLCVPAFGFVGVYIVVVNFF